MICFGIDHFSIIALHLAVNVSFYCVCGLSISFIHVRVTLHNCVGFCHATARLSHYMYMPSPLEASLLSPIPSFSIITDPGWAPWDE